MGPPPLFCTPHMQSLAGRVQMNGVRALGGAARPASSAERLRISGAVPLPRTQFSGPSRLGWVPHAPVSCRGAGSSPQCAASSAAAAGSAALPPPPAQQQQQPAAPPALPAWAGRVARLAGAALLFAAWYSLAGVLGGPFASVGLAAAPVANEGASGSGLGCCGLGTACMCVHACEHGSARHV